MRRGLQRWPYRSVVSSFSELHAVCNDDSHCFADRIVDGDADSNIFSDADTHCFADPYTVGDTDSIVFDDKLGIPHSIVFDDQLSSPYSIVFDDQLGTPYIISVDVCAANAFIFIYGCTNAFGVGIPYALPFDVSFSVDVHTPRGFAFVLSSARTVSFSFRVCSARSVPAQLHVDARPLDHAPRRRDVCRGVQHCVLRRPHVRRVLG